MSIWEDLLVKQRRIQEAAGMTGQPTVKSAWDAAPFSSEKMREYETGLPYAPTSLGDVADVGSRDLAGGEGFGGNVPDDRRAAPNPFDNPKVKAQIEGFLKQMEGDIYAQDELKKRYAAIPQQLDLSPLASLTDAWSGSKFAQTYKAPESQQEKIKAESAFQELQRKGRGDIVDALNKQLSNKGYLDMLRLQGTQQRFDTKRADLSDKQVDDINNFDGTAQEAAALLQDLKPGFTGTGASMKSLPLIKNFSDADAVTFQARLGRLGDSYRRLVTGAAAADAELKRIEGRLPQVNDPKDVFERKAKDYIREINRAKERYLRNVGRKGKDISGFDMQAAEVPKGSQDTGGQIDFAAAARAEIERRKGKK